MHTRSGRNPTSKELSNNQDGRTSGVGVGIPLLLSVVLNIEDRRKRELLYYKIGVCWIGKRVENNEGSSYCCDVGSCSNESPLLQYFLSVFNVSKVIG